MRCGRDPTTFRSAVQHANPQIPPTPKPRSLKWLSCSALFLGRPPPGGCYQKRARSSPSQWEQGAPSRCPWLPSSLHAPHHPHRCVGNKLNLQLHLSQTSSLIFQLCNTDLRHLFHPMTMLVSSSVGRDRTDANRMYNVIGCSPSSA